MEEWLASETMWWVPQYLGVQTRKQNAGYAWSRASYLKAVPLCLPNLAYYREANQAARVPSDFSWVHV